MKEAQERRWAKVRGESEPAAHATPESKKPKRKLSKAGKAAIVAALKKRWAAKKAEAAKPKPAGPRTAAVKRAVTKKATGKKTAPAASQTVATEAARR
jgi:hypothetical protein